MLIPPTQLRLVAMAAVLVAVLAAAATADELKPAGEEGFVPLFNGKDLTGWEGNRDLWTVRDRMIVGRSPGIGQNEFLATKEKYGDFELRLEFRLHGGTGNSGVQFRSKRVPRSSAVRGYQADIGENYWGSLYDEHRRNKVLDQAPPALERVLKKDGWNTYGIRAEGDHVVLEINGLTTVDYREKDGSIARSGIIALQIHSGPAMRIDFRNIRLRKPAADAKTQRRKGSQSKE